MSESSPRTSLIDEIAVQLFSIVPHRHQADDWPMARPDTRAVPQSNRLVDAEAGRWSKAAPRAPSVQRLATGDG